MLAVEFLYLLGGNVILSWLCLRAKSECARISTKIDEISIKVEEQKIHLLEGCFSVYFSPAPEYPN